MGGWSARSCGPTTSPTARGILDSATPPVKDPSSDLSTEVDVCLEGNTSGQQLNTSCYDDTQSVANVMPLYAGETGESPSRSTAWGKDYYNHIHSTTPVR